VRQGELGCDDFAKQFAKKLALHTFLTFTDFGKIADFWKKLEENIRKLRILLRMWRRKNGCRQGLWMAVEGLCGG
jgi:hypothetical protein